MGSGSLALGEPGKAEGTGRWLETPKERREAGSKVQGDTGALSQSWVQSANKHRDPGGTHRGAGSLVSSQAHWPLGTAKGVSS